MPNQIYKHLIIGINSDKTKSEVLQRTEKQETLSVSYLEYLGLNICK